MINDTLIICEGDKFIALDEGSGGYPVRVNSPWQAQHWRLTKDAISYRDKFPKEK